MIVAKATERSKMGIKSERLCNQTSLTKEKKEEDEFSSYVEAMQKEKGRKAIQGRRKRERNKNVGVSLWW